MCHLIVEAGGIIGRLKAGYFIRQFVRLVNQGRQALRTDMKFLFLKFQSEERDLLFGSAAVEAS